LQLAAVSCAPAPALGRPARDSLMAMLALFPLLLRQPLLEGPCDIFARGGTPCVAAHSVVRAMFAAYDGPLYSVRRLSSADLQPENTTYDIMPLSPGGVADAAAQDAYCNVASSAGCTIATIYDQSSFGNHLRAAPARRGSIDLEVNASADPLLLGGKRVYSAYFQPVSDYPNATGGHEHATAVGVGCK
jgi:non-reducing end alpha-L-arabinofuranosidase